MPNIIDASGLQVASQSELVANFTAAQQAIYGSDIDLSSSAPDGQMMMEFIQAVLDLEDLLVQINNMFDPDLAVGVILDQRVAINGIQRQAGTFTVTNITIVTSQALNLWGLDQTTQPVFTVSDNAGNNFQLQVTQHISGPGTYVFSFQAEVPGAVLTIPNTITVPVTIVLGVTSINNPTPATTTGVNEESDAALRIRRSKSVSLPSQGYLAGLLAALENINGVTSANVYENDTDSTDSDGTPSHTIWVVVAGTAAAADIANAIYVKRNAGAGMRGAISYTIMQVNGIPFVVKWDTVTLETLFTAFTATSIDGINPPNLQLILENLPANFVPGVNQEVDINHLATQVQNIDPNTLVTNAGFSDGKTQTLNLSDIPASGTFKVAYNGNSSAAINSFDLIATIQSKVQAIPGLSACLVTGALNPNKQLIFDLSAVPDPIQGLVTVNSNSLLNGSSVPITFTFDEGYTDTLSPGAKDKQFSVAEANIIILPMLLLPSTATVAAGNSKTFTGYGGYGTLVYSFVSNNSGGTINSSTGLYTAGSTPSVTDTIQVEDLFGNTASATITVT